MSWNTNIEISITDVRVIPEHPDGIAPQYLASIRFTMEGLEFHQHCYIGRNGSEPCLNLNRGRYLLYVDRGAIIEISEPTARKIEELTKLYLMSAK